MKTTNLSKFRTTLLACLALAGVLALSACNYNPAGYKSIENGTHTRSGK